MPTTEPTKRREKRRRNTAAYRARQAAPLVSPLTPEAPAEHVCLPGCVHLRPEDTPDDWHSWVYGGAPPPWRRGSSASTE